MSKKISILLPVGFFLLFSLSVTIAATPVAEDKKTAKPKLVTLKDGRKLEGIVTKTPKGIQVETKLAPMTFSNDEVQSIEELVTPKDVYITRRSKLNTKDAKAFYQLAKWVWKTYPDNMNLLQSANDDLEAALKLGKDYTRAQLLLQQVKAKIKILEKETVKGQKATGKDKTDLEKDLVTDRDILWIRLMELRETDKVPIKYKNDVLMRYVRDMQGREIDDWDKLWKKRRFLGWTRMKQVMEILANKPENTSLLKDIHVTSDPKFMTDFRTRIWPVIRSTCTAMAGHEILKPKGGLMFFVSGSKSVRVDYTNFLILSGFKFKKDNKRLIDRQYVDNSLVLQYGLNPKISKDRHPGNIPPIFTDKNSSRYRRVYNWIKSLKGPLAPNYHIHAGYSPAGMKLDTSGLPDIPSDDAETKE